MVIYALNRLLQLVPVVFILSIVVFGFVQALPGDIVDTLGGQEAINDPAVRAALEKEFGLDQPLYVQYLNWLGRILEGDFGKSLVTRRPVSVELIERIPATIYLAVVGIVLSLLIAIPLGTIAAVRCNTAVDYGAQVTSLIGISVPEF